MKDPKYLLEILHTHQDPWKRAEAALNLGEQGCTEAMNSLIDSMHNDPHDFVRRDCAEALGLLEEP
ncbi:MAG: HEAT repeat domain-containing protein, partial [Candidatus Kariarchaeaceae archaeon]